MCVIFGVVSKNNHWHDLARECVPVEGDGDEHLGVGTLIGQHPKALTAVGR